tara:strand:- start:84 stop:269 length:186 start_codon:yes stop_codon:yes gene_type:complete
MPYFDIRRKVRTPQDRVPRNTRAPLKLGMASATESIHLIFEIKVKWWCKRPPVLLVIIEAR